MSYQIGFNCHGKGRVRLVKVTRDKVDGTHAVVQYSVQILLEGDRMEHVFLTGDNAPVVATDTCKNTVYCLANQHEFESPEDFGLIICKHFLAQYPTIVNRVSVEIIADRWERLTAPDSKGKLTPHKHAFKRLGPNKLFAHVQGEKRPQHDLKLSLTAGFTNFDVMKTTQSGFVGFHRDRYTSLPDAEDRLLGTSIDAEWTYPSHLIGKLKVDYKRASLAIENALINTFAGPSDTGVYSKSVQQTLYSMAEAALKAVTDIESITLKMPNIHNISFPIEKYGLTNKDHSGNPTIFYPIDEPHGMIKATVSRTPKSKL